VNRHDEEEQKTFEQLAKEASERIYQRRVNKMQAGDEDDEDELHPKYSLQEERAFIKEMYRLKGLAYLRNEIIKKPDQQINDKTSVEQQLNVLKAATNFQKALGNK